MMAVQTYNVVATISFTARGWDENGNPITVTYNPGDVVNTIIWDPEAQPDLQAPANTKFVLAGQA